MNLVLPPFIEQLIEDRVRSGRYQSPADVVAAAVAQLDVQERASDDAGNGADTAADDEMTAAGVGSRR